MSQESLLSAKEIDFSFLHKPLFRELSFSIPTNQTIGLVGVNGAGKTTLVQIIAGLLEIDAGEIQKKNGLKVEYVRQETKYAGVGTLADFIFGDIDQDPEIYLQKQKDFSFLKTAFNLPGLDDMMESLSGGQKRQADIIRALLNNPDLLLLDEPTNHLDLRSVHNLQVLLERFTGSSLIISHDRYFLDQISNQIWELDTSKIYEYSGNYSHYLSAKRERYKTLQTQYEKEEQELKKELDWVRQGVKARGTKDVGRLKRYYELEERHLQNKPVWKTPTLPLPKPEILGDKILELSSLAIDLPGGAPLVRNLDFKFEPGMRLGILGPNGSGKTTLIQQILAKVFTLPGLNSQNHKTLENAEIDKVEQNLKGNIYLGSNTIFNYQDQHRFNLVDTQTIRENILPKGEVDIKFGNTKINIFAYLKYFLFDPRDLDKPVYTLSGGQKARLLLALILAKGGNFLFLDEPTNDLDIETLESLEKALISFQGCMVIVSHDRYFLDRVCTDILSLEGFGNYILSTGGYSDYIKKYGEKSQYYKFETEEVESIIPLSQEFKFESSAKQFEEMDNGKPRLSQKEIRVLKIEFREITKDIESLEKQIQELQIKQASPGFYTKDKKSIQANLAKLTEAQTQLEKLETRWLEIQESI